jgi:hypothetical protein
LPLAGEKAREDDVVTTVMQRLLSPLGWMPPSAVGTGGATDVDVGGGGVGPPAVKKT